MQLFLRFDEGRGGVPKLSGAYSEIYIILCSITSTVPPFF